MSESAQRAALVAFGLLNLVLGAIMLLASGFFFDHIGDYGVRNDHYTGDVGAFYVAGGAGLLIAAARPAWRVPVCVVAAVWYALHALNHLLDIGQASSRADGWRDTILLAIGAAALAHLANVARRTQAAAPGPPAAPAPARPPADYPPGD